MNDYAASYDEALYERAVGVIVTTRSASTNKLKNRLNIPYVQAIPLMERAQDDGIVSIPDCYGRRVVLVSAPAPK